MSHSPSGRRSHRPATLSESIYQEIFSLIVSGEYAPGARLPSEQALSQSFGVSRPVVREALARLRDDDLVVSQRGSGSYVNRRPDNAVLRFTPLSSISDMQRCFEFRVGVEGEMAYLAASRRSVASLKHIDETLAALDNVLGNEELGVDADFNFHMSIALATGNRFYVDTLERLRDNIATGMNLARNLSLLRSKARINRVQSEHAAIVEAIRAQKADRARDAMRAHLSAAKQRVFEGVGDL
jgi:GntR family transcriptional repressor for pyruvate dehydrogenase complex